MTSLTRRTAYYLLVLAAATVGLTGAYSLGMSVWEGRPRPWYQALEVVVQTFTTTGYGEDAPWSSPQMNMLVVVIQLAGIGFILSAVDVFVVPWLREALRPTAPKGLPDRSGHVIVCGYTPRVEVFIDEMIERGEEYVLIEPNVEQAASLYERDYEVMEGDPTSTAVLERASVGAAKALVADVADDENASIVLAAREASPERRIITLAEDASATRYHPARLDRDGTGTPDDTESHRFWYLRLSCYKFRCMEIVSVHTCRVSSMTGSIQVATYASCTRIFLYLQSNIYDRFPSNASR
mgnify:CR=1 FL=1